MIVALGLIIELFGIIEQFKTLEIISGFLDLAEIN
jgi:hypothetical protein